MFLLFFKVSTSQVVKIDRNKAQKKSYVRKINLVLLKWILWDIPQNIFILRIVIYIK